MILGLGLLNQADARSGTERFEARVGVRLIRATDEWRWRVYTRGVLPPEWARATGFDEVVCPPVRPILGGRLWAEQVSWARELRRAPPDLLAVPAFSPPWSSDRPFVLTVHDLAPIERPEDFTPVARHYWSRVLRTIAPRAVRLTTPSAWVRDRCVETLGYPPDRIDVVYTGIEPRYFATGDDAPSAPPPRLPGIQGPYWLHCGVAHPRKNLEVTIRALALLRQRRRETPLLVGVGAQGPHRRRLVSLARDAGVADRLLFPGPLEDETLARLYANCDAFVFPSWSEGFGVPPLEALAAGTRVLASNATCLPEILGDAPFWASPADPEAWVAAWDRARAESEAETEARRRRGRDWAGRYTWDDSAARWRVSLERACAEIR